ncbi:MAG: S41 family peptidase [Clostridia bacterium]|nr:S41 family peptidase [Clostridia bacterium]
MIKRLTALLLAAMIALLAVPAFAEALPAEEEAPVFKTLPIYYHSSTLERTLDVAFFNGCMDIPYCSDETAVGLLYALTGYDMRYGLTSYRLLENAGMLHRLDEDGLDIEAFYMLRENDSFVLINHEENLIWINDRDLFAAAPFAVSGGDLVTASGFFYDDDDAVLMNDALGIPYANLYRRVASQSYKREGEVTEILLDDYGIRIEEYDGHFYVPLATLSDLLLPCPVTFNGEALFALGDGLDQSRVNADGLTQYDLYYRPGVRERSPELAEFTYNELCLMLDHCYGLREEHGALNGFDSYFIASGLEADLKNTDPHVFTDALYQVLAGNFGDLHSGLSYLSSYAGNEYEVTHKNKSITLTDYNRVLNRFLKARAQSGIAIDDKIQDGYYEIGDTAFVTFDSFVSASHDYYDPDVADQLGDIYMSDTISLVIWAHNRIHREDSPIRKVVIDLSCNGGGHLNACMYIASWVLGAANLSVENVTTGAQYTTVYWVDVNLDGQCLEDDELGVDDLDVYCLVNGSSFSCGNLLPTLFKQDGRVTLLGQTSGGGACVVRSTSAADGTLFDISDVHRLCIVKNGTFYSIDRGVDEDIPLRKPASYYDRAALAEYLDTIR